MHYHLHHTCHHYCLGHCNPNQGILVLETQLTENYLRKRSCITDYFLKEPN